MNKRKPESIKTTMEIEPMAKKRELDSNKSIIDREFSEHDGDWKDNNGKIIGKYTGSLKHGKREGYGTMVYNESELLSLYEGDWKNDTMHGVGNATYKDGRYYEGTFENNMSHGLGTLLYSNGSKYDGTFENDNATGLGITTYNNGEIYKGDHVNGIREGKGEYHYKTSPFYMMYTGDYKNGLFDGHGELHLIDGTNYIGEFKDNKRHGNGKLVNAETGDVIKDGQWENDTYIVPPAKINSNLENELPETVVLTVFLHGGYTVNREEGKTIKIPSFTMKSILPKASIRASASAKGKSKTKKARTITETVEEPLRTLRVINAVATGVTYYYDSYILPFYVKTIQRQFLEYQPEGKTDMEKQIELDKITRNMSTYLKELEKPRIANHKKNLENMDKKLKALIKERNKLGNASYLDDETEDKKNYLDYEIRDQEKEVEEKKLFASHYKDSMYCIEKTLSTDNVEINDKGFGLKTNEDIDSSVKHIDGRLNIVNIEGMPNLFDETIFKDIEIENYLNDAKEVTYTEVSLKALTKYLYSKGVKNIILIDFSCSECGFGRITRGERSYLYRESRKRCIGGKKNKTRRIRRPNPKHG
jgi:hypothetical protein